MAKGGRARHRWVGHYAVLVLPTLLSGCSFEATPPAGVRIRCESTASCPSPLVCRQRFCIDPSNLDLVPADLAEPPTVTPGRGRAGAVFTIGLTSTKPLIDEPELTLRFEQPLVLPCTRGGDDLHFSCEYTALGTELGGLGGQVDFDVRLLDKSANETIRRSVGVLNLDFTAPGLALASVGPAEARFGSTIEVFFTSSEPLSGPAVVTASRGLDDGAGGTVATFSLNPEGSTLSYRLTHVVTAKDGVGEVAFSVVLTDVAGNTSAVLPLGSTKVDGAVPAVLRVSLTPERAKIGTVVEATFEVSKLLAGPPTVTLGGLSMIRDVNVTPPQYRYTYTAQAGDVENVKSVLVTGNDLSGNVFSETLGVVTFDFTPPQLATATAFYSPSPSNPLTSVTKAKAGTLVIVSVIANEPLGTVTGPGVPPTLNASNGSATLNFCLVGVTCIGDSRPSSYTATGASFEALVPQGALDGTYTPTLTWTDVVGNSGTVSFTMPALEVKTSQPVLSVNQAQVTFVRSPWGNAAAENLGVFTIPSGPYYALAPGNSLANVASLPANAFTTTNGTLQRIRAWTSPVSGTLVGTLIPNADGSWPRGQLANVDVPTVYVSGLDEAGNESPTVKLANAEWVATPNPALAGTSPHSQSISTFIDSTVTASASSIDSAGLEGSDGTAVLARAEAEWRQITIDDAKPVYRWEHAMAYDSARGRVVMFGGSAGVLMNDVWEWDGVTWTNRTPSGLKPSARQGHAMVYDSARSRTVLFGGSNGTNLQDVWEWDGTQWLNRTPATNNPSARAGHAMAYDSARSRTVLFGGISNTFLQQDTWEWDGTNWLNRTVAGTKPSTRSRHAMAYDSARGRTVLFGGFNGTAPRQDVWEWDGTSWVNLAPTGTQPSARALHAMAYDQGRGRTVVFSGNSVDFPQDVWEWDGVSWFDRTPSGTQPSGRTYAAMVYDSADRRVVMFGGADINGGELQDLWQWDGFTWVNRTPIGTKPSARIGAALAYDSARGQLVMFGGINNNTVLQDVWEWDGTTWTDKTPAGLKPSARSFHAMAYDSARGRVVMFGGWDRVTRLQDVWEWNGTSWVDKTPTGPQPGIRSEHAMAYDSSRSRVVVFGGISNGPLLQDLWEWDGTSWVDKTPTGTKPSRRYSPAMAYDSVRNRMVVFGGYDGAEQPGVWEWDGVTWVNKTSTGPQPSGRSGHVMAYDSARGRMVMFGGYDSMAPQAVWELNSSSARQPALGFIASARGYVVPDSVTGLRVRAHCGGTFSPFGPGSIGATLHGWVTGGTPAALPGSWRSLAVNGTGINTMAPWLPAPNAALIDWTAASGAEARQFILERDMQLAFQCRPSGSSGVSALEAQVALDAIEVRVRYAP